MKHLEAVCVLLLQLLQLTVVPTTATKALLVLCQEEEGKLEIQRNIRARLQNPLFSLG